MIDDGKSHFALLWDLFKIERPPKGFRKGNKVLCIDDTFTQQDKFPGSFYPSLNQAYTIRKCIDTDAGWGLYLVEVVNKAYSHPLLVEKQEPSFSIERFQAYKK